MIRCRYTRHARDQMANRSIGEWEVDQAFDNRTIEYPHKVDPHKRVIIGITATGRRLKLVLAYDDDPPVLVTVAGVDE